MKYNVDGAAVRTSKPETYSYPLVKQHSSKVNFAPAKNNTSPNAIRAISLCFLTCAVLP